MKPKKSVKYSFLGNLGILLGIIAMVMVFSSSLFASFLKKPALAYTLVFGIGWVVAFALTVWQGTEWIYTDYVRKIAGVGFNPTLYWSTFATITGLLFTTIGTISIHTYVLGPLLKMKRVLFHHISIGILLVGLSVFLVTLCVLASRKQKKKR